MKISIVIRCFNEQRHIGRLLFGITQQTVANPEIILVDSGSTDGTLTVAAQYPVKIEHIRPDEFTFGRALNRGIAAATGEIVVITSAHCYPVYPDWLEQLVKPLQNPDAALSYGKQRAGTTNHYSERRFFRKYFPDASVAQQAQPYSHNANAAIRRGLWEQHPYNEALTGLEDLAWSSWALEAGYSLAYVAEAEVVHQHEETLRQVYKRYQREAIALKHILPESRFTLLDALRQWLRESLADLNMARREGVLLKQTLPILTFRLLQYWGTYRGYHYAGKITPQLHQAFYYPPQVLDEKLAKGRPVEPIAYDQDG
jgi:cellulose synthase/poly-beta-1,6-N-acetylglucosamine synthase-like glycosyltransferase